MAAVNLEQALQDPASVFATPWASSRMIDRDSAAHAARVAPPSMAMVVPLM